MLQENGHDAGSFSAQTLLNSATNSFVSSISDEQMMPRPTNRITAISNTALWGAGFPFNRAVCKRER